MYHLQMCVRRVTVTTTNTAKFTATEGLTGSTAAIPYHRKAPLCSSRTWTGKWIRRRSESVPMWILHKPHYGKFDKINPPNSAQKQVMPCLTRQKYHGIFSYSQNPTVFRNITLSAAA